ncbi:MAG: hypothetical protein QOH04_1335 [Sphingomonadales bacterium]|nr:hypothetical protein [Sphingomonadales bacterium]MEA3035570.1 hypothetical protein [Sphingomonadales bacterium]
MSRKDKPLEPEPPAEAPPPTDWKTLLGPELSAPHPERAGPAAVAGPGRGRR